MDKSAKHTTNSHTVSVPACVFCVSLIPSLKPTFPSDMYSYVIFVCHHYFVAHILFLVFVFICSILIHSISTFDILFEINCRNCSDVRSACYGGGR